MISAVINTLNEEKNLEKCLKTLGWVDEIVVCDDGSVDRTIEIALRFGAKIYRHKSEGFVEAARNFAIDKAKGDWILIVDADEEIPQKLAKKLEEITRSKNPPDCVAIARKNIIFGKWIEHSGWWPDYNVRFFKKGKVKWIGEIHKDPETQGVGCSLLPYEEFAVIHHNYQTIGQYIARMNRYTDIEAKDLINSGYKFSWLDLIKKPNSEFLSRFFAQKGYLDGLHGLILATLQSLAIFVRYIKVWELQGAAEQEIDLAKFKKQSFESLKELKFWLFETMAKNAKRGEKLFYKLLKKL